MVEPDLLKSAAAQHGAREAIVAGDRRLTYAELDALAERFGAELGALGVRRGERVGILMRNLWQYPVAFFGAARAGAVSVNLPVRFAQGELAYVLGKIPLSALVIDAAMPQHIEWAGAAIPARRMIRVGGAQDEFAAMLRSAAAGASGPGLDPDGPAAILFTSGTTGYPKGVLEPGRGRVLNAEALRTDFELTAQDVIAVASPLYHAAGLYCWYYAGVLAGASAVLFPAWDPGQFIESVGQFGITGAFAVPTQLAMLLRHPQFDPARMAGLRLVVYGGASSPSGLIEELERALPQVRFVQNYGMTEIGPLFCQHTDDRRRHPGSIGRPNASLETALFAEPGRIAAPGEVGEIVTRGSHVMLGYFDDPESTREFFRYGDGWGATGDLAVRDAEGYLTLVGRTRDTIISGAVNIYPSEIERVARSIPGIADCAAFGVRDEVWGELPAIAVVKAAGAEVSAPQVIAGFDSGEISRFKRPRAVFFVDALPYAPSGKLLRGELRRQFPALPAQMRIEGGQP